MSPTRAPPGQTLSHSCPPPSVWSPTPPPPSPPCGSRFATPYSYGCLPGSADGGVQSFRSIPLLPGASRPSRGATILLGGGFFFRKDSKVGLLTGLAPPSSAAGEGHVHLCHSFAEVPENCGTGWLPPASFSGCSSVSATAVSPSCCSAVPSRSPSSSMVGSAAEICCVSASP